ncbi:hypothetical protein K491DRAFT_711581 [Lophiostoma macrostomum CBS 122681]|uniref:RING-type domain-containing protein n=1 Tax=Lophiostoma macrostomum CBS 122681 TaxID=1314788 RepID=A0A6A6TMY6_9PLEO|nr:hypothetical protein K491DRAFT_711581 [Lophiostoma macrostomum CBS 122681]
MPTPAFTGLAGPSVHIQIGKHTFTIHEDVLCAKSKAFRERLQHNRKDIPPDCPICHSSIIPEIERIVYCRAPHGCGQNMHAHCVEKWLATGTTCPYCRTEWEQEQDLKHFIIEPHKRHKLPSTWVIDGVQLQKLSLEDVMGVWFYYAYTGTFMLDEGYYEHKDRRGVRIEWICYLFRLFILADILRDAGFKTKILSLCLKLDWESHMTRLFITDWIYRHAHLPKDNDLRTFVVDMITTTYESPDANAEELESIIRKSPWLSEFVADVAIVWLKKDWPPLYMDEQRWLDVYEADDPAVGFKIRAIEPVADVRPQEAQAAPAPGEP